MRCFRLGGTGSARSAFLLELYQGLWDNAVYGVGTGEGDERACDFAHEAGGAAAVDEGDFVGGEGVAEGIGGG